ncbi:MAG: hypothetical protein CME31_22130 [Gimesia sp.]|uniref:Dockerin domain-containing protein n=1 Tax=Gimesia maris TaxID=122 RepID=A0A3D3RDW2_9PLAN|nr:hypothetical protein [Gimesia sp.]HCO27014.1 hypothetical protein [Gimesia maris]|tara:strand:- start:10671 stop:13283 length:2613 start_codon:yes stop_codon:yes gene_type:complete
MLTAAFSEFVDPNPSAGNEFGDTVVALSTGNVVITSPYADVGGTDTGAVYLFNGATGVLISQLVGSTANDKVGEYGITELSTGNYVVRSPFWDNGSEAEAGAVTFGNGTTGASGVVSAANSLVGSNSSSYVGFHGVTALTNGNYVVISASWSNGSFFSVGAVTFGDGITGVSGVVSAANSLVGSTGSDNVGLYGVTALANGNYVVNSYAWENGAVANAGAVTFGNGMTGVSGVVSATNSLVGSTESDLVGEDGITELSSGNYLVRSPFWDNGSETDAGAVTFGNGTTGVSGRLTSNNSVTGVLDLDISPGLVQDNINNTFFIRSQDQKTFRVGSQTDGFSPLSLNAISDVMLNENASEQIVNLVGISASGPDPNQLSVTATSSNTGLIPDPVVFYTSPDSTGSLTFTPVANQVGIATITVTVEDGGLDGDLGTTEDNGTFQRTFDVIVNTLVDIDLRVVGSPTLVESNGEIASLPANQNWVSEWSTYWVEIWMNTDSTSSQGIFSANLDLNYNTQYTSATTIEYGTGFTLNQTGSVNDLSGVVENLYSETNVNNLGISGYLLFARIQFESLVDDGVDLDTLNQTIGPYDLGFLISSPQVTVVSENPVSTDVNLFQGASIWANPFDLNDDDKINYRDLISLVGVYGAIPSESDSDYAWAADLDQSDRVDYRDLISFVGNYGKGKVNDPDVNYPSNYPEAWNNLLRVSSEPQRRIKTANLTQTEADQVLEKAIEQVSEKLTPEMSQALSGVEVKVVDLSGATLGRAVPGTIYLDVNAAGYGWFVDSNPFDHSEFAVDSQLSLIALPDSAAAGRIDLWTVILHELGHLVGYEHEAEGVMEETLAPGVRKLAEWNENSDLFFASVQDQAELLSF